MNEDPALHRRLWILLALAGSAAFIAWLATESVSLLNPSPAIVTVAPANRTPRAQGPPGVGPPGRLIERRDRMGFKSVNSSTSTDLTVTPPDFPDSPQFLPRGGKLNLTLHTAVPRSEIRYSTDGSAVSFDPSTFRSSKQPGKPTLLVWRTLPAGVQISCARTVSSTSSSERA